MRLDTSFLGASTRNRVLVIIGVVASSLWILYPIGSSLKLGLDLNGGVQLVLRVKTDEALLLQTQAAAERLRTALTRAGVSLSTVDVMSATEFRVYNAEDESAVRQEAVESASMYERASTGGTHIPPAATAASALRDEIVEQALRTIDRRVNDLGLAESVIARYTAADQILVQLPGVSDIDRAIQIIKSTAQLRLTLIEQGPFASRDAALLAYGSAMPPELDILPAKPDPIRSSGPLFYVVQRAPALTGNDLRIARQALDEYNRPAVGFTLKPDAAQRCGAITERNINRDLATVLDGRVMSVATIESRIDDQGRIVGVTRDEMIEQVVNLNSGALPADLEYVEERTVGASLGAASIQAGMLASLGGLGLVLLFMLAYYRLAGVNALISVVLNLLILLAFMAYIPAPLTLPGIAGLILTIGIGVDSNVLITASTTLLAVVALYVFGGEALRGFAFTMLVGIVAGTYFTIFIASATATLLSGNRALRRRSGSVTRDSTHVLPTHRRTEGEHVTWP